MPRRKTKETQYDVEMVSDLPGPNDKTTTKTVTATSDEDALRKATQGDPMSANADKVVIKKKQAQSGTSALQMETKKRKTQKKKGSRKIDPDTMELVEKVDYPYSIMLPIQFESLCQKVVKNGNILTPVGNNKIYIKIETKEDMTDMLSNLKRSRDKRSNIIYDGIKESVN